MTDEPINKGQRFTQKVWVITSIVALTVIIIWIVKATFNVLLLVFAGALIALYFRGLSDLIHRYFHIKEPWSVILSIVITLLLLSGFVVFAGSKISQQVSELSQTLPDVINKLKSDINKSQTGGQILDRLSSGNGAQKTASIAQSFFRSTFGVLGDLYVVLFIGLFFTASPKTYINGLIKLVPPKTKHQALGIVDKSGVVLKKWLKGKLLAMLIVTVLTLIGLLIIDVRMAFVLALIAGILNFIPNFGPVIAMIPAVLIGFMQGPVTAAMVAGLYILVQVLESNLITPQIQKKLVSIPPALIIIAQLFMGVLTGGWGLVLATPVLLILIVLIEELYIKKTTDHE